MKHALIVEASTILEGQKEDFNLRYMVCIKLGVLLTVFLALGAAITSLLRRNDRTDIDVPSAIEAAGFARVIQTDALIIEPDLDKRAEYRVSQLIVDDTGVWPGRKVLYRSTLSAEPYLTMVLPLDVNEETDVLRTVVEERKKYCKQHNYGLFIRYIQDFAAEGKPASESLGLAPLRMLRQALVTFPGSSWFWLYGSNGHIRDRDAKPLAANLTALQQAISNVEPEAVPLTHFATHAEDASIIASFDKTGLLSSGSLMVNNSVVSNAFLELATDPILQEWPPFAESDDHAGTTLTHISRWHRMFVGSIALILPERNGILPCTDYAEGTPFCMLHTEK